MLMCGKVTNDNLIDNSHYFRNTDQYEKLMWGFSYISFCLSKHFGGSDVFVSFLLTANPRSDIFISLSDKYISSEDTIMKKERNSQFAWA